MALRDWFIVGRTRPLQKGTAVAAAAPGTSEGVFLSPKSIVSFPVASALVGILWKLGEHYFKVGDIAVLYISLALGALIFLIAISNVSARPKGMVDWIIAIAIALLNSLFLAASALGLVKEVLK